VRDIVNHYDFHATLMHLFGLKPENFTFTRPGGTASLLDGQEGKIVAAMLKNPLA
jgi:hypothetical protein